MSTVYILKDERGRIYVGSTTDIVRRLSEHHRGHTASTRKLVGIKLVWQKETPTLDFARKAEKKIKRWKSRKMIDLLIEGKIQIE